MKRFLLLTALLSYGTVAQPAMIQNSINNGLNSIKLEFNFRNNNATKVNNTTNASGVLIKHLSKKLQSNNSKQLLGIFLTSLCACDVVGCSYHWIHAEGFNKTWPLALLILSSVELARSLDFTFHKSKENVLAIAQDYTNNCSIDPNTEKKVRLLFKQLGQALENIHPNGLSEPFLTNLNEELLTIQNLKDEFLAIQNLKEEDRLTAILSFFEKHGNTLTQDDSKHELKNNSGKHLFTWILISSLIIWAPIIVEHLFDTKNNTFRFGA